jgi:CubicO group peptidase (beta-lactamase class C family)
MKTKIQFLLGVSIVLYFAFFNGKCQNDVECTADSCFSIDSFAANIKKSLAGMCMGYAFVIDYKGKRERIFADGLRRTSKDGGNLFYDIFAKFHTASMAKTLTAIATLRLLKQNNLTTYTKITNYLPSDWQLGTKVDKITFRDLLRHESGIRNKLTDTCDGDFYSQLKCKLKLGVADSFGIPQYQNMNFSLLRILISKLDGHPHLAQGNDTATANNYIRYVRKYIFEPCSALGEIQCTPDTNLHYYVWPYDNTHGQTFGDYSQVGGAFGWYLSVSDYGNVISKLFNSEVLLTKAWRDTMTANNLGCYPDNVKKGTSYNHNGGWGIKIYYYDSQNKLDSSQGSANCGWINFPNGIDAVCMVNSDIPGNWFPGIFLNAYAKAWKQN